jgi:hypothetical protein
VQGYDRKELGHQAGRLLLPQIKTANRGLMKARYEIGNIVDPINGWFVLDTKTGGPAAINDVLQVSLLFEDADDLADLLNHLEAKRITSASH